KIAAITSKPLIGEEFTPSRDMTTLASTSTARLVRRNSPIRVSMRGKYTCAWESAVNLRLGQLEFKHPCARGFSFDDFFLLPRPFRALSHRSPASWLAAGRLRQLV